MAVEGFTNDGLGTVTSGGTTTTDTAWTVSVSQAFPGAVSGVTQFHVADTAPGMGTEKILVASGGGTAGSQAWTVVRGAEGSTPLAHAPGFTVRQVVTAGALGTLEQLAAPVLPADLGWLAWNFSPALIQTGTTLPTSGTVYLVRVNIRVATAVSNVILYLQTSGAGLTTSQCFAGLYDSSGDFIATTADQSGAWGSGSPKWVPMPLAGAPFTLAAGSFYWVAILAGWSTTAPSFGRAVNDQIAASNFGLGAAASYYAAGPASAASLPTGAGALTPSGFTQTSIQYWVGLS